MGMQTSRMYGPSLRECPQHDRSCIALLCAPATVRSAVIRGAAKVSEDLESPRIEGSWMECGTQTDKISPSNVPADCINLGQGFMNWSPPSWVLEASHKSMDTEVMSNHYSHPRGRPNLMKAVSKHYSPTFENLVKEGRELTMDEIVITAGANCGLSS